jgi:REP element-mobilizing transposase RayT
MDLSALGRVAAREWARTLEMRPALVPDAFVVMPNHVHLLFGIADAPEVPPRSGVPPGDAPPGRDTMHGVPTPGPGSASGPGRRFGQHHAGSVSSVVGAYKAAVTRGARRDGLWREGPLWQGRFHDRVVRSAPEADRIRRYIAENPARWHADRFRPDH